MKPQDRAGAKAKVVALRPPRDGRCTTSAPHAAEQSEEKCPSKAEVSGLAERRVEQLSRKIEDLLRRLDAPVGQGSLTERRSRVSDVEVWRAAARRAAHRLGWKVRTGANSRVVWMLDVREAHLDPDSVAARDRAIADRLDHMIAAASSDRSRPARLRPVR